MSGQVLDRMTSLAHKGTAGHQNEPSVGVVEMHRVPQITVHAFCDTPEMLTTMENLAADRRMVRTHAKVHRGGIAAAVAMYVEASSPNLVIVESTADPGGLRAQLDALADVCATGTKLIVVGYANDVALYRDLLGRGVSEYLVGPVNAVAMIAVIAQLYQNTAENKLGQSFAFIAATGGAGSSTVAHNVASTLGRTYGCDVILADFDLAFGSASLGFNLNTTQGMAQALQNDSRLDYALLESLLTKSEPHLSVLTAPATLEQPYDLLETTFEHIVEIAQANVPYLVLDLPHVWNAWTKRVLRLADQVVITATPDLVSLRNAKNLVEQLKDVRLNDTAPRIVLNQTGVPKRVEIKADKFAEALGLQPIASIPFEPATFSAAANKGSMIADISARSTATRCFGKIAQAVSGRDAVGKKPRSRFPFARLWKR